MYLEIMHHMQIMPYMIYAEAQFIGLSIHIEP